MKTRRLALTNTIWIVSLLLGVLAVMFAIPGLWPQPAWNTKLQLLDFSFRPDSTVVATAESTPQRTGERRRVASLPAAQSVRLRNLEDGKVVRTIGTHTDDVRAVGFSPDGHWLASGSLDHTVKVWQASTGQLVTILSMDDALPLQVQFSPNGKFIAVETQVEVKIWQSGTWKLQTQLPDARAFSWSPDSKLIAGFSHESATNLRQNDIHFWRVDNGAVYTSIETGSSIPGKPKTTFALSPNGQMVAVGDVDVTDPRYVPQIRIFDVKSHDLVTTLRTDEVSYDVNSLAWREDGRLLAVGYSRLPQRTAILSLDSLKPTGLVHIWQASPNGELWTMQQRMQGEPGKLRFAPGPEWLVLGSFEGRVQMWPVE